MLAFILAALGVYSVTGLSVMAYAVHTAPVIDREGW